MSALTKPSFSSVITVSKESASQKRLSGLDLRLWRSSCWSETNIRNIKNEQ